MIQITLDMDIPKTCYDCPFKHKSASLVSLYAYDVYCDISKKDITKFYEKKGKPKNICPLKEI